MKRFILVLVALALVTVLVGCTTEQQIVRDIDILDRLGGDVELVGDWRCTFKFFEPIEQLYTFHADGTLRMLSSRGSSIGVWSVRGDILEWVWGSGASAKFMIDRQSDDSVILTSIGLPFVLHLYR